MTLFRPTGPQVQKNAVLPDRRETVNAETRCLTVPGPQRKRNSQTGTAIFSFWAVSPKKFLFLVKRRAWSARSAKPQTGIASGLHPFTRFYPTATAAKPPCG